MRRRISWVVAALLLIGASAYFMAKSEPSPATPSRRTVDFPRVLRPAEVQRIQQRQRPLPAQPDRRANAESRPRDPFLSVLPQAGKSAVVIEANAIRNSPIGELLIRCFVQGEDPFARMREESGIDVLTDLDRVGISEEGLIFSGHFKNARWDKLGEDHSPSAYGDNAVIYSSSADVREAFGRWGDQMIVGASSANEVRAILDRLSAPSSEPRAISEEATYGEIYGVLGSEQLAELLGRGGAALADRIREAAPRVEVHVDAREDVAIVAQVRGSNRTELSELGKAVAGLLSASRLKAKVDDEKALAELLDLARVLPHDGGFDLELALPLQFFEKHLGACADPNSKTQRTAR